jgi:hypothetical protein
MGTKAFAGTAPHGLIVARVRGLSSRCSRMAVLMLGLAVGLLASGTAHAAVRQVLRVGSYNGKPGQYASIQEAVDAAHPGDWILIGPGDYKEASSRCGQPNSGEPPSSVLSVQATCDSQLLAPRPRYRVRNIHVQPTSR